MSAAAGAPLVVTLGCRLNALESQVIGQQAAVAGLGDAVIVNTCAVTNEAVRQARQTVRRLARQHPGRPILVTGCAAELEPGPFQAMPEVAGVVGNAAKLDGRLLAAALLTAPRLAAPLLTAPVARRTPAAAPGNMAAGGLPSPAATRLDPAEGRARGFVQVQQGCDHRCTFCIVPFSRGGNRSLPADAIIAQVARLAAAGLAEVVLTGVDICSYGHDQPGHPGLAALVRLILAGVPALPRLRLSTLDPAAIDDALIGCYADEPRLMPHAHLSLQAADDMVLKRMRRRHERADAARIIARLRRARPDIAFGADLIAGFPTETDAMAANTLAAVDDFGLTWLHVFPYSPRSGTPAARMPQVPARLRRDRAAALRRAGADARARYLAGRLGAVLDVVVERSPAEGGGAITGRAPDYASVIVPEAAGRVAAGTILPVVVTGSDGERLLARVRQPEAGVGG